MAFVISLNVNRRHMDASQRAMAAAKIATLQHGQKKSDAQICASSQTDAAESLNVSRRSVQTARKVLDHGSDELKHAVEAGEVAVSKAAEVTDLPKSEQLAVFNRKPGRLLSAYLHHPCAVSGNWRPTDCAKVVGDAIPPYPGNWLMLDQTKALVAEISKAGNPALEQNQPLIPKAQKKMETTEYYEVEGAVFRSRNDVPLELFNQKTGKWGRYTGDSGRVFMQSNPMTLAQVRPYMDVEPVEE